MSQMFQNFLIANGYQPQLSFFNHPYYFNSYYYPVVCDQNIQEIPTCSSLQMGQSSIKVATETKTKKCAKKIDKKRLNKKTKARDCEFKVKAQNVKRNVVSNLVHHLVSFIERKKISEPLISKIIELHKLSIIPEQFYSFITKINLKNYVKVETLRSIWRNTEELPTQTVLELSKLFRIITFYFLNQECYNSIQLSKKIRSNLKDDHFKKRRELIRILCQE